MAERVRVREITNDEGNRLLRMVRRSSGSVVTWRRAQMVLLSAQGMDVAMIARVTFTSPDRVRDVIHNFNTDGFDSLRPSYAGGRPPKFDTERVSRSSRSRWPGRPIMGFRSLPGACPSWPTTWWRRGWSRTSLTRGCGCCCARRASPFQAVKTWKTSTGPDYEAKKNRVLELYATADGKTEPGPGNPTVVICMDCLDHDRDGTLLIWDNHKAHRRRRRLPVTAPTATAIADWPEARRGLHCGDRRDD
jgi:hypothetical protein